MSAVSEGIVRDYLEALGFLVQQPRKYQVMARSKRADEEIDLIAVNPNPSGDPPTGDGLWSAADVRRVRAAVVGIRGWHTETFTPGLLEMSPEVFRFAEDEVVRQAERLVGGGPVTRILCVPSLAASDEGQRRALEIIRSKGIDGVLSFRTILIELSAMVDTNRYYEKSDLLQILRILKTYGLIQGPQLDLFRGRGRRARAVRAAGPSRPAAGPAGEAGAAAGDVDAAPPTTSPAAGAARASDEAPAQGEPGAGA